MNEYIFKITCPDKKGLVAIISNEIYKAGFNIESNNEFVNSDTNSFYFLAILSSSESVKDDFINNLKQILTDAQITFSPKRKKNIIILASKELHCLGDLLLANYEDELNANILKVMANHDLSDFVKRFDIDFSLIDTSKDKELYEQDIIQEIKKYNVDYIVLAKYMRILSPNFVNTFKDKIINIHHSFLPAFIGANPYLQAYERGVKIIGASAHFVTDNLDEGPIIFQDIVRVNHTYNSKDLRKAGKKIETLVLRNALEKVFDDKVFIAGNKTIIF